MHGPMTRRWASSASFPSRNCRRSRPSAAIRCPESGWRNLGGRALQIGARRPLEVLATGGGAVDRGPVEQVLEERDTARREKRERSGIVFDRDQRALFGEYLARIAVEIGRWRCEAHQVEVED